MYKLTNSTTIIRTTDGTHIPHDLANTDYQEYLNWVSSGNAALPADTPVIVPITTIPTYIFRDRFTDVELSTLDDVAYITNGGDKQARLILLQLFTANAGIPITDPRVINAINYLVTKNVIVSSRVATILAPM